MKLADEWRSAWRWLQNWLIVALAAAPLLYEQLGSLQGVIPAPWFKWASLVLGVLTIMNNVRKKA